MDNKALPKPEKDMEFKVEGDKKYEIKAIINSTIYGQQANSNQMPGLYYLVLGKGYLEEKNTWKLLLAVIHLQKLISTFHKEHPKKPTAISSSLNFVLLMAKLTVPKKPKQKRNRLNKKVNKRSKNQSIAL